MFNPFRWLRENRELERMTAESWYYEFLTKQCSDKCLDSVEDREAVAALLAKETRGLLHKVKF